MSDPFIGEIQMFAGNFAPRGWSFCNGQLLPIAQNTALFSILGTTYGGDGRTSFGLPDLRGRAPIHSGQGPGLSDYRLGERGGAETALANQTPQHNHVLGASSVDNQSGSPIDAVPGLAEDPQYRNATDTTMAADVLEELPGGSGVHNNMQPFNTVNFIVALIGTFPSRN
jgi:microcystin-dependent protein